MCMRERPADPGVECCLALWQLKGKREYTLWYTQRYCTDTCTCVAYRKTHMRDSNSHTHTHTGSVVPYCFHRMHAALSCQPFIWKCMRQKFLLGVVPGFVAQHCTTVLCVVDLSHDDGLNQSTGNTHVKLASHLRRSRLVLLWASYNSEPQPRCTFSHSSNVWGPELVVPLAPSVKNMTVAVTATSLTPSCCFKVVASFEKFSFFHISLGLWGCAVLFRIDPQRSLFDLQSAPSSTPLISNHRSYFEDKYISGI